MLNVCEYTSTLPKRSTVWYKMARTGRNISTDPIVPDQRTSQIKTETHRSILRIMEARIPQEPAPLLLNIFVYDVPTMPGVRLAMYPEIAERRLHCSLDDHGTLVYHPKKHGHACFEKWKAKTKTWTAYEIHCHGRRMAFRCQG